MLTLRPRSVWDTYDFFRPATNIFNLFDEISKETYEHRQLSTANSTTVENDDCAEIFVELPGVNKKKLNVTAEAGRITIKAEKNIADNKTEVTKSWTVGKKYDLSTLTAELTDGVLRLKVDKIPETKPRQIKVK